MQRLTGRTALVTGAAGGIGSAICRRLAAEGARVVVTDIDPDPAEALAAEIGGVGRRLDITDHEGVAATAAAVEAEVGPVDILVNNAGADRVMSFLDSDSGFWRRTVDLNLVGCIAVTHAFARRMAAREKGTIVNIASDAGRVGSSGEVVYSAAKGGVIAFTKAVARELARHRITVNCVCPGPTNTPFLDAFKVEGGERIVEAMRRSVPLKRLAEPDEIAAAVAFFASPDAAYITGQTLSVSGGLTMV